VTRSRGDRQIGHVVFRRSLSGSDADGWLEIPLQMFDRSACTSERMAADAHADLAALITFAAPLRGD